MLFQVQSTSEQTSKFKIGSEKFKKQSSKVQRAIFFLESCQKDTLAPVGLTLDSGEVVTLIK